MGANLKDRTIVMSGGSRGIGLAIALRAARDGANVVMLAKTDQPHPSLEGTVHTAATAVEEAGGRALAVAGDVRNDADVTRVFEQAAERFGGVDIVVNNASAIDLSSTQDLPMKKYDLMQDINARGTFLMAKTALPYLEQSDRAHVLTLSPPINLAPRWAGSHLGYTMAKYAMSLVTLGLAEEAREAGIAVNSLWPRTTIATAAVRNILGGDEAMRISRTPQIMADAAHVVLTRGMDAGTGQFLIDDEVLASAGITDLSPYGGEAESLALDLFLDPPSVTE